MQTYFLTILYHLVHTVVFLMPLVITLPHTSSTYEHSSMHVLAFPVCAVSYPVCS